MQTNPRILSKFTSETNLGGTPQRVLQGGHGGADPYHEPPPRLSFPPQRGGVHGVQSVQGYSILEIVRASPRVYLLGHRQETNGYLFTTFHRISPDFLGTNRVLLPILSDFLGITFQSIVEFHSHGYLQRLSANLLVMLVKLLVNLLLLPCCCSNGYMFFFQIMSSGGIR